MASLMETEDKVHVVSMMGDAGFGSDGANEDNREEEALREMWQQCEDPEEKRQLRTRMYKLREDRIRDFYVGRDGQEILESILRTDNVSSRGCGEDDNANLQENRSVTSVASMVVTSSEIQSGHELTPVTVTKSAATVMKQVSKQGVTTTTTTSSKKTMKTNSSSSESDTKEETKQVKNRGTGKDRSPSLQLKEIKEQKNQHKPLLSNRRTVRRKSSAGENEIMAGNIGRIHPKQTSTVTYVLSNKVTNNQGKVVAGSNNIRNGVDAIGDRTNKGRRDSRVSKRGEQGNSTTTTITARNNHDNNAISSTTNASSSITTKTTIGGSTRVSGDGRKVNNSMIETTTITNMRSTKSSTMTTVKNVSSSTTIGRIGFSSTARKIDGAESFEKSSTGHKSRRQVMSSSLANESIPLGSVHIEELMETPGKDEVKVQRGATRAKKSSEKNVKESTTKYQRKSSSNADGEPINRNLSSSGGGGGGQQVTKSEMTKANATTTTTNTSSARTCSKGSATLNIHGSSSTTATGSSGDRSTGQDRGNKVVNKSRESSPKRSGSSYKGNSTRGTKATLKTGESLETPVIKVDREGEESSVGYGDGESVGSKSLKKDNNKTEESIIRELDILDNYLSQRSISIDEASAKESEKVDRTITTTTTMELGRSKPVGGENLAGKSDVMEVGIEPPFTRTEYKYNCPGEEDHHRHHKDHHHEDSSADRNTNELREPQSARNRDHDTKLNSSIEDQIIVDVVETSLTPSTRVPSNKGKSRSSSKPATLKANLSTNSATSKTNIKSSSAGIEPLMPAKKVDPTFLQIGSRQSSSTQMQIKQQKNETEILNRPSRKEQPKLTGTKNTSTFISLEEKVKSKPEPNPRALKKSFDGGDDDDETVEGSVVKMNSKVIRRDNVDDNNEDDNDDPLRPQTMKQGHDHPGAVLKAKSLFETKAQEAAMDRASADFDMDKGITQSAKVSKKAALFEARSRGERISVSSESSVATSSAPDEKGGTRVTQPVNQTELTTTSSTILSNTDNENANKLESPKKVSSTLMATSTSIAPTLKREKSILTAASKEIKDQDSSTATTVRSIKRKTSKETSTSRGSTTNTASAYTTRRKSSEVKFDTNENTAKTEQTRSSNKSAAKLYQQRRDSGKSETDEEQKTTNRHPRRKSTENGRESQKKELQSCVTTTSSTTCNRRRASQDKKVSPEPQPAAHLQKRDDESKRNENRRPSFPSHSTRKNSLQEAANCTIPTTTGSALLSRSDKLEQDENKRVESSGNTLTMTSTSVQINSNRMTTTELNAVMEIEDIEELTRLLEKATDYDERSKIRGRIRGLKRKAALVKRPSAENETTEGETLSKRAASAFTTNISSTSESVSIMNAKNKAMSSTTTTSTTTTNTTCGNGRKKSNERRRSSGEIPSNKVTTRKKSSELIGRENSSDDNNKNASDVVEVKKTLKANVVKSANDERKVRNRNKSSSPSPPPQSQLKPHAVTPQTIETTLIDSSVPTTTSTTMGGGGERRLSWETQQLLSTRKYSRDSPRQGEDEKKVSKVIDDVTPTPPNIKSGLTKEKVEPTPEEKTLGPAPTLEEKPTRPFTEEKTPKPLIKKPSRDKTSPPRVVSSLIESVAASTTMQKSREMTKAEKYEADILSRPSVFCQRRQEQQESQNTATKQEQVTTTTTTSFKSKALKTGETSLTSAQKSSSWNQEIKVTKEASPEPPTTKSTSRKKSADDSQDKVVKVTRKSSKDEIKEKSPPPPTRVPQRSSPAKYTRKGSSKEFKVVEKLSSNESAKLGEKIEMISKIPTTPAPTSSSPPASKKGGATTKDDQKSEDDKHKSDTEINFNQTQQSQSSSPPTTKHPKSQSEQPAPPPAATTSSLADRNKKTVKTDTPVKKNEKKSSAPLMDSSNSTSTTGSTITKFNLSTKSSSSGTTTNDTARDSHSKGTESVTSSYGVGPTDDDGTPLFGLKALRKIKQVQEQITTSTTSSAASTESTEKAGLSKEDAYTSTKQSLRASENFGLKALKKGSIASKGLLLAEDEDEEDTKKTQQQKKKNKIPESSVPEGSTRQTKSEFLSSTTTSTIRLQSSSSPPATTETETAEQRGANLDRGNSPKSILKKTSSFTSQIGTSGEGNGGGGGVVKSKTAEDDDDGNNFDEIESGTINSVKVGEDETTDEFRRLTTTSSTTSNITHSHSLGSDGGMEDSSWRRKSATPSPDPMNASSATNATTSGLLSLSRGKVGRSSVKEMSKRFLQTSESGETLSNCQTQQNLNEGDVVDHKPVFIRGSSPSRIPSPVKPSTTTTTITTTTKSSVEVSGGDPDGNIKIEVNRGDPDHEEVSYYSPSDSDGGGSGIIRITRTVTTTSGIGGGGGGRSFLNDSSPIQNLSDVIERMRGEEGQRKYTEDFSEDAEEGDCEKGKDSAESGLNLLNKFIGAQIIMKSVEPMLLSKKVTMSSSSLIVNGVNVDVETDPVRLRQLLAEVEGEDRERIGNRLRSLESGGTSVERSASTPSTQRSRPLTKTLSIGGVTLGSDSSDVADVTEERFSFNRSQFSRAQIWAQSSSKSLDMSNLMSGLGGGGSGSHAQYYTPVQSPPFCNQNYPFYDQQMQTF
ncbi:serine-rich adhesin for platelets isoform X3 [Folsomia candida]|nr:serine-rich adhesin for platelets isoform X3 [Folsomia candida]